MKKIEKSAEKDYNDLKAEYQMQVEEIHNMDLSNKELKRKLEEKQRYFNEEIEKYAQAYETSRAEAAQETEQIKADKV